MIKIEKTYYDEIKDCNYFSEYFKGNDYKIGVLDIETTGLSPQNDRFILGGLLVLFDKHQVLHQFFAETPDEEAEILCSYMNEISKLDVIVTYNGKNFDMAFLRERCKVHNIRFNHNLPHNLDLYQVLRKYSELKKFLPNLRQKTVESFFGLWDKRTDEITGAESVLLYNSYCNSKDKAILDKILLHNHDDLLQLAKLVPILSKTDMHRGMSGLGFPIGPLSVSEIKLSSRQLQIIGIQRKIQVNYLSYPENNSDFFCCFDKETREFELIFPVIHKNGLSLLDIKNILDTICNGKDVSLCLSKLHSYPYFSEGFAILEKDGAVNYLTLNIAARTLINILLENKIEMLLKP